MNQRGDIVGTECGVTAVDDAFQIFGRDFSGRDIETEDLQSEVGVAEVFPTLL